jgi:hypothetical protein
VAEERRLHLDVALELADDTIRGTVDDGVGPAVDFTGWLELMWAFDTACARAQVRALEPGSGADGR